jgi:hypothetical protein
MLARVHWRPPLSANCATRSGWTSVNGPGRGWLTETATRGQAAHHGQHGRGATPGKRRGDLVGAESCPVPAGLANHAGPDGTRQPCYAVDLPPYQFNCVIVVRRSPSVKSLILRAAMHRACRIFACAGLTARSVVCVQITRLWRAAGLAGLRIVPRQPLTAKDPAPLSPEDHRLASGDNRQTGP